MKRLAAVLLLAGPPAVHAATCQVGVTDLPFGSYRTAAVDDVENSATVTVSCSDPAPAALVSYTISIGPGLGGDVADRAMAGPGAQLHYNVYIDESRTLVWGDGTGGSLTASGVITLPGTPSASHTAYGRIPAQQSVVPGSYADVLTITVDY